MYAICAVRNQLIQGEEPRFREIYADTDMRQIKFTLSNDSVTLEPGILSYAHGNLTFQVVQQQQGNFLSRAVRSAGSGESAFGTLVSGTGEV